MNREVCKKDSFYQLINFFKIQEAFTSKSFDQYSNGLIEIRKDKQYYNYIKIKVNELYERFYNSVEVMDFDIDNQTDN